MIKKLWMSLVVCCAALFLCAGENTPAESADETAVKEVVLQFHRCLRDFDIAGAMALIHSQGYEHIDADGNKRDFNDWQQMLAQLADMGKGLQVAEQPELSLEQIVSAVFAMNSGELDSETKALISGIAGTESGRKLADESRRTLADMLAVYRNRIDEKIRSFSVISVAVENSRADLVYLIKSHDGRLEKVSAVLIKNPQGKWQLQKQRAVYAEPEQL